MPAPEPEIEKIVKEPEVDPKVDPPADPPKPLDLNAEPKDLDEAKALVVALRTQANKEPEWVKGRIGSMTAKLREAELALEAKDGLLRQYDARVKELETTGKTVVRPSEEEINTRASAIASQRAFDEKCNAVIETGAKAHPTFSSEVEKLHAISPLTVKNPNTGLSTPVMPTAFIETVLELDAPHEVLHALAQPANNDEAARIMALPVAKQAVALAKFSAGLKAAPRQVSHAPPPTDAIEGKNTGGEKVDLASKKTSVDAWMKERAAQVAAARAARH